MDDSVDTQETSEAYPMTAAQNRVLAAMDKSHIRINDALAPESGTFWQVALGVLGIGLLLAGTVLVFFFAALGAVMLVAGGLSFIAALQGASFSQRAADRLAHIVDDEDTQPPTAH